jgi:hypothetical protein
MFQFIFHKKKSGGPTESLQSLSPREARRRSRTIRFIRTIVLREFADAAMGIWLLISRTRLADPFLSLIVCCCISRSQGTMKRLVSTALAVRGLLRSRGAPSTTAVRLTNPPPDGLHASFLASCANAARLSGRATMIVVFLFILFQSTRLKHGVSNVLLSNLHV